MNGWNHMINYIVNARPYTAYSDLTDELQLEADKNYLFDLDYLGLIHVKGERADEFLQGQLSCDVREVDAQHMRPGVSCNLKGRILASVEVLLWDKAFYLALPKDLCTETQASLAKTAPLSKVSLAPCRNYVAFGLYLQNPKDVLDLGLEFPEGLFEVRSQDAYYMYHLGKHFYKLWCTKEKAFTLKQKFQSKLQWRGSLAWHALQLQTLRVEIYPESRGLFLPHRLDLHKYGYLSFDKGCYKGQEIIARTHYRAQLKHHMKTFRMNVTQGLRSGLRLLSKVNGAEIGELVDFCPVGATEYFLNASVLIGVNEDDFVLEDL
jgi:folate-binding protein YgfZ